MVYSHEKFLTLTDNLFRFSNYSCRSVVDIEHISPNEIQETLKLQGLDDKTITFAFMPGRGLVKLNNDGSINEEDVLQELLSLSTLNKEDIFRFFAEYGFFFPININNFEPIDINHLKRFINRIKALIQLISDISEANLDYFSILNKVLFLQLSEPSEFELTCFQNQSFKTYEYTIYTELKKAPLLSPIENRKEAFNSNQYHIKDQIYPPIYKLDIDYYNDIINGLDSETPGVTESEVFRNITKLYCTAPNLNENTRLLIDFLFHFHKNIGLISEFDYKGDIEFYEDDELIHQKFNKKFNTAMRNALLKIAKFTIRDELEYNLYGIRPSYDINTMSPTWLVDDFLSAIYFSIFYMNPNIGVYRKCKNVNCDRWFLVKTTANKRKYCDAYCRIKSI